MKFKDLQHKERFIELAPGNLSTDLEWAPVAFIVSSNDDLWEKCYKHMDVVQREIEWESIFKTDFGTSHKGALYFAFAIWAGCSWGGWLDKEGREIPVVDTMAWADSMDLEIKEVVYQALAVR